MVQVDLEVDNKVTCFFKEIGLCAQNMLSIQNDWGREGHGGEPI